MLTALALVGGAAAGDVQWPQDSASEFSAFVTLQRFRIYTDHCSASVPLLKPEFERLAAQLPGRIQGVSKGLLASDAFRGMKGKPVPVEIVAAFKDSLHDAEHNFERKDAAAACPKTLQSIAGMGDEALGSELRVTLTAVQNMIRNLEHDGAPQVVR